MCAHERLHDLRAVNNAFNDQFVIRTLQEVVSLARQKSVELGRTVGVYPETKHSTYSNAHAEANGPLRMDDRLVQVLHANYGNSTDATIYVQSFELSNLQYLNTKTRMRIAWNWRCTARPCRVVAAAAAARQVLPKRHIHRPIIDDLMDR